jgi:hypothetical protein
MEAVVGGVEADPVGPAKLGDQQRNAGDDDGVAITVVSRSKK